MKVETKLDSMERMLSNLHSHVRGGSPNLTEHPDRGDLGFLMCCGNSPARRFADEEVYGSSLSVSQREHSAGIGKEGPVNGVRKKTFQVDALHRAEPSSKAD